MRIVPIGAACLLLLASSSLALGQTEEEVVRLLVPIEAESGAFRTQSAEVEGVGWKRLVAPVKGSIDETVADLRRELGTDVIVENSYPLAGPDSEPQFGEQWALENIGQRGGTVDADIDARDAWSRTLGGGVVVAVVDSGVNPDHPELDDQMWTNPGEIINGLDDDGNGLVDDVNGWDFEAFDNDPTPEGEGIGAAHATLVAGIVAAEVDGVGITGVAPGAEVMNVKACRDGSCFSLDAAEAIYYAAQEGADVIILSFGGPVPASVGDPAISAAVDFARQRDVLVVSAAGNLPPAAVPEDQMVIPAELPQSNNMAVAATDRFDRIAQFSFRGPTIDIAAPGLEIVSTALDGYASIDGTSFSAPFVAGAAALLLSADPGVSHLELVARLQAWADRPPGVSGLVESGRLNAGAVLTRRFIDTSPHTFEGDAEWAAERGVTQGCNPPDNTKFCPDEYVPRGQMAAFLRRFLDLPPASRDHFIDDQGSIFEEDINRLAEAGITRGCNPPANDEFCPGDTVTRQQMAAFLVRALDLIANAQPVFVDVESSNTFYADIGKLATAGITRGCNPPENDRFCPGRGVTRGEMVAFLHRSGR